MGFMIPPFDLLVCYLPGKVALTSAARGNFTRTRAKSLISWRASRNKTANSYVIEITL
jgi:hypothetical protein